MLSVADIRTNSSNLSVLKRPIFEPINAPSLLSQFLGRFDESLYNVSHNSNLYKYLLGLAGDIGAGSRGRGLLLTKLQQQLQATHFTDLDKIYGNPIGLSRLPDEIYTQNPYGDALTSDEWDLVFSADASYRARCLTWMRAIIFGGSPLGMALAAQAASGIECDVVEQYNTLDFGTPNWGKTSSRNEFVIVPRIASLNPAIQRNISHLLDLLKPQNTLATIHSISETRTKQDPLRVAASTEAFVVQKFITGRSDVNWPTLDPSEGLWITTSEEEAPTFAFLETQESQTFLTISSVTASSTHVGIFNATERGVFPILNENVDPFYQFLPDNSFASSFYPIQISSQWQSRSTDNVTIANKHYPLEYLALVGVSPPSSFDIRNFWSSEESSPTTSDALQFDLGSERPFNYLDFEIIGKPISFAFQYSTDGITWNALSPNTGFNNMSGVTFIPGQANPWIFVEQHFAPVIARYILITFNRESNPYPFKDSSEFAWTINIRNLRLMHLIDSTTTGYWQNLDNFEDFIADSGTDILGNSVRTALKTYPAANSIDGNSATFWKSRPNPIPEAVEALYLDMRPSSSLINGTMNFLDQAYMRQLDTRGMSDVENYYTDSIVVDDIYLDPLTYGATMHIYYSMDDTPDWDNKLWTPIPQTYILKKGFHSLPYSTNLKYLKLEFSDLVPVPYNIPEYPAFHSQTYRRFPTWVQNYFSRILNGIDSLTNYNTDLFDHINVDPLTLGFTHPFPDQLDSDFRQNPTVKAITSQEELQTFLQGVVSQEKETSVQQQASESKIAFINNFVWQTNMLQRLDTDRAIPKYLLEQESPIQAESAIPILPPPSIQSTPDLTHSQARKQAPTLWFPVTCRHAYQQIQVERTSKIAYYVGLKEFGAYRRAYNNQTDEDYYIENFNDSINISSNNFIENNGLWTVTP